MKYLKLFNESKVVGRDLTNFDYDGDGYGWRPSTHNLYWYKEIEKRYKINKDELSWILSEFVEDFDLLFSCYIDDDTICVKFLPYVYLTNYTVETLKKINFQNWIKDKGEFAGIFYSIDERLLDYDLTIKYEKDPEGLLFDDIYDEDENWEGGHEWLYDNDDGDGFVNDDNDDFEIIPLPEYNFKIYDYEMEHSMKLIIKRKR